MTSKDDNKDAHAHSYLKYRGTYNWKDLMRFMRKWVDGNHYTFFEKKYKEKPGNYGIEIDWSVEAEKKVDGFYKYWIKFDLKIWDQMPVEVIKDGKKVQMDDGRIRILFNSVVDSDYEGNFENSPFQKKLEKFLLKHVIKEDESAIHWDGLYYEMNRFKNEVEAHLKMETATVGSPYH